MSRKPKQLEEEVKTDTADNPVIEEKANAAKAKADEARNASKALADKTDKEKAAVEEKKMKVYRDW